MQSENFLSPTTGIFLTHELANVHQYTNHFKTANFKLTSTVLWITLVPDNELSSISCNSDNSAFTGYWRIVSSNPMRKWFEIARNIGTNLNHPNAILRPRLFNMKLIFALLYLTTIDCCTVHVYLPHTKIPFIQTSAVARNIHVNFYMWRICLFLGDNLNLESENFGICAIFLNSQCVISLNLCHLVSLLLFAWTSCVIPLTTRQIHHVKWFSVNKDMHETYIHHKKKQVKIRHKSQIQLISLQISLFDKYVQWIRKFFCP